ncbi:putative general alpha-glucoside permease protein [Eutypa lata UCREL1]|uniref:Putative general alpha-glucoside permease protein n=1 Tax=Eutypa lata (strain UCR-EL1) TaxID=1287681 RepID=M7T6M9_EUTLA|nr:putative general alpha-glucoside permease protein [Eutypa lata UCREL1]
MSGFIRLFGADPESDGGKLAVIVIAIISIYFLDVALNTEENPHMTPAELDQLYERATRVGTFAMLVYSVTSLATNVILPSFIDPTFDNEPVWLVIPGFTLKRAWMLSHILFAAAMFAAPFIRTVRAANVIIGFFGITWAMTLWAPWAIISAELSRRDFLIRAQRQRLRTTNQSGGSGAPLEGLGEEHHLEAEAEVNETGVIMGIHNMAIAAPQFIATIVCSIVFDFSEKPRGVPGDHSIAISFAVGGVFVFFASFLVLRIKDDISVPADAIAMMEGADASTGPASAARSKGDLGEPRSSLEGASLARNASFDSGREY